MNKRLTHQQVIDLYNGLQASSGIRSVKLAYAIARNLDRLEPIVRAIGKSYRPESDFIEYDKQRAGLAKAHAKVDESGAPIVKNVNGVDEYDVESKDEFDKEYKSLRKKYAGAIHRREKQLEEFKEFLTKEVTVDLYMVDPADLPDDISSAQLTPILDIVGDGQL